jgi:hypothetical protein
LPARKGSDRRAAFHFAAWLPEETPWRDVDLA